MIISLIMNLFFGALAGWLAGYIMKSDGGIVRNIILGLCGGVIGSIVLGIIGLQANSRRGSIIISVIGACILIWAAKKLKK